MENLKIVIPFKTKKSGSIERVVFKLKDSIKVEARFIDVSYQNWDKVFSNCPVVIEEIGHEKIMMRQKWRPSKRLTNQGKSNSLLVEWIELLIFPFHWFDDGGAVGVGGSNSGGSGSSCRQIC